MSDVTAGALDARVPRSVAVAAMVAAVGIGALWSLATGGRSDVGFADLVRPDDLARTVLADIRAPRTLAAACLGVNLGLAGLALQAITRNPLASPGILGINQGAAFGLALAFVVPAFGVIGPEIMAILGAFGAGVLTFAIAGGFRGRMDPMRLILGGVSVGAFSYAMVRFTFTLEDEIARSVVLWTVGNITDIRWNETLRLAIVTLPGLAAAYALSQRFNLIALGQDAAQGLGADPRVTLLLGTVLAAVLAGVSVSVAGPIAFTGLVVPHLARFLFGGDHRVLILAVAGLGAALMLLSDALSKVLTAPIESPIGVVAALIGAPWFVWLAVRARGLQ